MCGAVECAFNASTLSHFSITRKVSGPYFVWKDGAFSVSTAAPYSMQPFSARTAGTLARKCLSTCSRMPGLVVRTATTWIMAQAPSLGLREQRSTLRRLNGARGLAHRSARLLRERLPGGSVFADHSCHAARWRLAAAQWPLTSAS